MDITRPIVILIFLGMLILFLVFRSFPEASIVLSQPENSRDNQAHAAADEGQQEELSPIQGQFDSQVNEINAEREAVAADQAVLEQDRQELVESQEALASAQADLEHERARLNEQINLVANEREKLDQEKERLLLEWSRLAEERQKIDETRKIVLEMQGIITETQQRADEELALLKSGVETQRYLEQLTYILVIGLSVSTLLFNVSIYLIYRNAWLSYIRNQKASAQRKSQRNGKKSPVPFLAHHSS